MRLGSRLGLGLKGLVHIPGSSVDSRRSYLRVQVTRRAAALSTHVVKCQLCYYVYSIQTVAGIANRRCDARRGT